MLGEENVAQIYNGSELKFVIINAFVRKILIHSIGLNA